MVPYLSAFAASLLMTNWTSAHLADPPPVISSTNTDKKSGQWFLQLIKAAPRARLATLDESRVILDCRCSMKIHGDKTAQTRQNTHEERHNARWAATEGLIKRRINKKPKGNCPHHTAWRQDHQHSIKKNKSMQLALFLRHEQSQARPNFFSTPWNFLPNFYAGYSGNFESRRPYSFRARRRVARNAVL